MRKILVITYYWVPSGGAGVQRWLKFVKYLRNFEWEPVVYTPENPELPAVDYSLESDIPEKLTVLKTRIWEPYAAYKKFVGRKKEDKIKSGFLSEKKNPSLTEKVSVWIRGNLFIPDARKFWIKPSIKFLSQWLSKNHVDAIVSTGPPHSMHLIARAVHQKFNIPWLADFRDPWTNIDFYDELMLTGFGNRRHHKLEKTVLTEANRVIAVSEGMADQFKTIVNRDYQVITNGYDLPEGSLPKSGNNLKFVLAHIGSLVPARNPENFWKALQQIIIAKPEFGGDLEILLVGQIDYTVKESLAGFNLLDYTTIIPYLPHNEVTGVQRSSGILLLFINNTANAGMVVTGKIFEYLVSGRPILCIGPGDGDAARIISETHTGISVGHEDLEGIREAIVSFYERFKSGMLKSEATNLEKYSRYQLTRRLAELLNEMVS
jgi:hypothetical protein